MKGFELGEGEISISPLAFESLGVRGMSVLVETDDVSVLVDPGSALGPRFNLSPHEIEYTALVESKKRILQAARRADIVTISHYHFDHYTPHFHDWLWLWSSPETAEKIYGGKQILVKDIAENINVAQKKRGYLFLKKSAGIADVKPADRRTFRFGETVLRFSRPVPHGEINQGYLLMLTVKTKRGTVMHASDVQGPMDANVLKLILRERPDLLILGGPPIYLRGFKIESEKLERARTNMLRLCRSVGTVVVDHHLLRSADYADFISPLAEMARLSGNRVCTASELVGLEPQLLEAHRRELHQQRPVPRECYKKLRETLSAGLTSSREQGSP